LFDYCWFWLIEDGYLLWWIGERLKKKGTTLCCCVLLIIIFFYSLFVFSFGFGCGKNEGSLLLWWLLMNGDSVLMVVLLSERMSFCVAADQFLPPFALKLAPNLYPKIRVKVFHLRYGRKT
jgi:hypothetical protein